jgi:hypothetical protein
VEEQEEFQEEEDESESTGYDKGNTGRKSRKRSSSKHFRVDEQGFPIIEFSSSEEDVPITRAKRNQKQIKKEEKKKVRDWPVGSPARSNKRKKDKDKENSKRKSGQLQIQDEDDLLSPLAASATGSDLSFPSDIFSPEDSSSIHLPASSSAAFTELPFRVAYCSIPLTSEDISSWTGLIVRHTISEEIGKIISFHSDDSAATTNQGQQKDPKNYRVEIRTTWGDMKGKSIHFEILNKHSSEYLQYECANILPEEDEAKEPGKNQEDEKAQSLSVDEESEEWKVVPIFNKNDEGSSSRAADSNLERNDKKLSVRPPPSINHHRFITPADLKRPGKAKLIEIPVSSTSAGKNEKEASVLQLKDRSIAVNGKDFEKFVLPIKNPLTKEDELVNAKYFEQYSDRNPTVTVSAPARKYTHSSRYQQPRDRSHVSSKDHPRNDRPGKESFSSNSTRPVQPVPAPRRSNPLHRASSPPLSPTSRNSSSSSTSFQTETSGKQNSRISSVEERNSAGRREIVKSSSVSSSSAVPVFSSDDDTDNRKLSKKQKTSFPLKGIADRVVIPSSTSTIPPPPPVSPTSLNPRDPRNKGLISTDKTNSGKILQNKVDDDDITELLNKFKKPPSSETSPADTVAVPPVPALPKEAVIVSNSVNSKPSSSASLPSKTTSTSASASSSSRPTVAAKSQVKTSFNPSVVSLKPGNRVSRFGTKQPEGLRSIVSSTADIVQIDPENAQEFTGGNYDYSTNFDMQQQYEPHVNYPQQEYYPMEEQQGLVTFPDGSSTSLDRFEYNAVQPFEEYYPLLQESTEYLHPQLQMATDAVPSIAGQLDPKRARFNKNTALTKASSAVTKSTRRTLPHRSVREPLFSSDLPPSLDIPFQQSFPTAHSAYYTANDPLFYPQFPGEFPPQAPSLFPPAPMLVSPTEMSYDQGGVFLHPPQLSPPPVTDSRGSIKTRNPHHPTSKQQRSKEVVVVHKKKVSTSEPEDGEVSE